jgi:anaerobic nitric oxide reductase flavorubredoxin
MKAVEIKPDVYWVGAIDWAIRDFHGYVTPHGTTYNNYLVVDEKITLFDTVKYDFAETTIENIRAVADPSKIENIVINHIENDHVTSIDKIMYLAPGATLYITEKGKKGLERFYDISSWKVKTVKTGDTLNIGRRNLIFIETPMIHWPDSMMTYIKEDKILISQDGFGQHLATSARFDDEFIECASVFELDDAVIDYYANILMPFGTLIKNKIAEIQKLGFEIDVIAPDHGIIWRRDPGKVLKMYLDMAGGAAEPKVVIIYDTMWTSTEAMTLHIMRGIKDEGVDCKVIKLRSTPTSVAIKEFWRSRGMLVGSPTLNNKMFPSVAEFLHHLAGLRPKDRIAGAFGSYGWGGGAVKEVYDDLKGMKLEIFEPGMEALYRPSPADAEKCYEFGREFAKRMKEFHGKVTL